MYYPVSEGLDTERKTLMAILDVSGSERAFFRENAHNTEDQKKKAAKTLATKLRDHPGSRIFYLGHRVFPCELVNTQANLLQHYADGRINYQDLHTGIFQSWEDSGFSVREIQDAFIEPINYKDLETAFKRVYQSIYPPRDQTF